MNLETFLTDKPLCAISLASLALWAAARYKFPRWGPLDGEAVATAWLRVLCGLLMVLASYGKLGDAGHFQKAVENYQVLPSSLVPLAAVVIPWLEFFMGLCLALGWRTRPAALLMCLLMGIYALSLSVNLLRGVEMNCSCFSKDSLEKITGWTVLRDLLILSMGWIVLASRSRLVTLESFLDRPKGR